MFVSNAAVASLTHAHDAALPFESCGFLYGPRAGRRAFVTEVAVARGSGQSPGWFAIDDLALRRLKCWGEDRGLEIVAMFHSHPSGIRHLSAADRAALAHSEWPWVIVTRLHRSDPGVVLTGYRRGDGRRMTIRVS